MVLLVAIAVFLALIVLFALKAGVSRPPMSPEQIAAWEQQKAEAELGNPSAGRRYHDDVPRD